MPLRFQCASCGSVVISRFLKPGEGAICRACSATTVIPQNALTVTDEVYNAWLRAPRTLREPQEPQTQAPPQRAYVPPARDWEKPQQIDPALIGDINKKSVFDYFDAGWRSLGGRWGLAVGGLLLYGMIQLFGQLIPFVSILFGLLATPAFAGGFTLFFLNFARNTNPKIEDLFAGFERYGTLMGIYYITMLCSTILIIPIFVPMIVLFESPEQIEEIFESHAVMFFMAFFLLTLGFLLVAAFLAFIYAVAM
ncbi:MAG: hypothetical protein ACE5GA_08830, partial [Candidatus Zixiibacteriota bacterium]